MEPEKSFLDILNDHWDEEKAHRTIFIGTSEIDGKRRAVFYDGKPANRYLNDNSYFHCFISERTIEEHVRKYKSIVNDIKKCLSYHEKGKKWLPLKNAPKYVTYTFKYPNGKQGDIDYFLAQEYGKVQQISPLQYKVKLSTRKKDVIEKFIFIYRPSFDPQNTVLDMWDIYSFLSVFHVYHRLRYLADEYHLKAYGPQYHPLRNQCRAIAGKYIEEIRKTRHSIYCQLIENKNTSSKWVSEQQAFSIVKSIYADAVYQYQSEWLGKQSLDIYIPSIKVGIEYQGQQHYIALEFFGGIKELEKRKQLDENKRRKCKENNVILIEWKYYDPLTSEYITKAINSAIENKKQNTE